MRQPTQPIYTEILNIMLNSEFISLAESRKLELIEQVYTPDQVAELQRNEFLIISILANGILVISPIDGLNSYEDIDVDDIILN